MPGIISPSCILTLNLRADLGTFAMMCRSGLMEEIMEPVHGRYRLPVLHFGCPLSQHARGGLQHCIRQ